MFSRENSSLSLPFGIECLFYSESLPILNVIIILINFARHMSLSPVLRTKSDIVLILCIESMGIGIIIMFIIIAAVCLRLLRRRA